MIYEHVVENSMAIETFISFLKKMQIKVQSVGLFSYNDNDINR